MKRLLSAEIWGCIWAAGTIALLLAVAPEVPGSSPAGASTPVEFVAVTAQCIGSASDPASDIPGFLVTLYNAPNASPVGASGTMTSGNETAPWSTTGPSPADPTVPNAWLIGDDSFYPIAPTAASWGRPATVTVNWNDGHGTGGTASQLVGISTCENVSQRASAMATAQGGSAYWAVTSDGEVAGAAAPQSGQGLNYGGMGNIPLNAQIVGMAARPDGQGYWLLGGDGGIFTFGLARFYGSTGGMNLNAPIVGMATTLDGDGYWLVASDGGVFAFGDASFYGSMGGKPLNKPVVGMAADQATGGYWLVASDGGIFSFNAPFHGSTGSLVLNAPIVGMESAPDGSGYRLAAVDGGVFSFDLPFGGSFAGQDSHPMVSITGQGSSGYRLLDDCGGIYAFGSAPFYGADIVC